MPSEITQIPSSILALLAALLGSILTIGIGKVLDLIQKRQEHKYSLQRIFFEKKIKVAEEIVGQTQKIRNFLEPLGTTLSAIPDLTTTPEIGSFLVSQIQTLSSQIQNIQQEAKDYNYAASLYFDKAILNPVVIPTYQKVFTSIVALFLLGEKAKALTPNTPEAEKQKIKDETIRLLMDFKSDMDSVKTGLDKFISDLRDEMRKYEP